MDFFLTLLSFCHPGTGCSFFLCSLRSHAGLLFHGNPSSTWLGFDTSSPGYHSVNTVFILFELWHITPGHPSVEMFSLPYRGCEFPMPDCFFEGISSSPFGPLKPYSGPLFKMNDHHPVLGAIDVPSCDFLSDLASRLINGLSFPAL